MGNCSKCEPRTSKGHMLRTSPLILAYLEHKPTIYLESEHVHGL